MTHNQKLFLLLLVILSLLLTPLVVAQEGETTPEATAQVIYKAEAQPVVEPVAQPDPASFDLGETIPILGIITILIALIGVFYILNLTVRALSISVPQEVIHKIGESLVNNMNETMKTLSDKAALTPTPIDDIMVDIGEMTLAAFKQKFLPELTVEDLISEIQKRNAGTSASTDFLSHTNEAPQS